MELRVTHSRLFLALLVLGVLATTLPSGAQEDTPENPTSPTDTELGIDRYALIGDPAGPPLSGDELEQATLELSRLLRCPVCQGLSVADSPAASALAMRVEVRELLSRGYSKEQAADYFESTYGEFVRLQPRARGLNWLVWLAPLAALLLGFGLVFRMSRSRGRSRESESDIDLAEWREKVRQETGS